MVAKLGLIGNYDPQYGQRVDIQVHRESSYVYSKEWKDFFRNKPNLTATEIEEARAELVRQYRMASSQASTTSMGATN